jgi:hypothetical protein
MRIRLTLGSLGLTLLGMVLVIHAGEQKTGPSASDKEALIQQQQQLVRQFEEFQLLMLKLRQRMERGTAEEQNRAKAIGRILDDLQKGNLKTEFDQLAEQLRSSKLTNPSELKEYRDRAEKLTNELQRILAMFQDDPRRQQLREESQFLKDMILKIGQLIEKQQLNQALTENNKTDKKNLEGNQNQITKDIGKTNKAIDNFLGKKGDSVAQDANKLKGGPKEGGKNEKSSAVAKDDGEQGTQTAQGQAKDDGDEKPTQIAKGNAKPDENGTEKNNEPSDGSESQAKEGQGAQGSQAKDSKGTDGSQSSQAKANDGAKGNEAGTKNNEGAKSSEADAKAGEQGSQASQAKANEGNQPQTGAKDPKGSEGSQGSQAKANEGAKGSESGSKANEGAKNSTASAKPAEGSKAGSQGSKGSKGSPSQAKAGEGSKAGAKEGKGSEGSQASQAKSGGQKGSEGSKASQGQAKAGSESKGQSSAKSDGAQSPMSPQSNPSQAQAKQDKADHGPQSTITKEGDGGSSPPPPPGNQKTKDTLEKNQKKILEAGYESVKAENEIIAGKKKPAIDNQQNVIDNLQKTKEELEKLLRQTREEELERLLAALEARCRKMLDMQVAVLAGTEQTHKSIQARADKKAAREDQQNALRLSDQEKDIILEANKAIQMLEEEGSAVAFPEVFQQVREDMKHVQRRLEIADVAEVTQAVEKDIIASLQEMIEALKKAQQQAKAGPPKDGQPPPNADQKLLDKIAELKMIRSLQKRVNDRTQFYGRLFPNEQAQDLMIRQQLQQLAERQERIFEIMDRFAKGDGK